LELQTQTPKNTCQSPELHISQTTVGAYNDEQGLPPAELAELAEPAELAEFAEPAELAELAELAERRGVHRDDQVGDGDRQELRGAIWKMRLIFGRKESSPTGPAISECEGL
jgi:hypothetical protein